MILQGLKKLDIGTKLLVFGVPFVCVLLCEFLVLSMSMGKPFCLQYFESSIFHLRFIIGFVLGYVLVCGMLIAIISEDLRKLAK